MPFYQNTTCVSFQNIVNHDTFGYITENKGKTSSFVVESLGSNLQIFMDPLIPTLETCYSAFWRTMQLLPGEMCHPKGTGRYKDYIMGL